MNATPAKLRNGTWGARTSSNVREGDIITITTRSGKSWDAKVSKVVWTGNGVAICATEKPSAQQAPRRQRATWTGCSCGSVEEYEKKSDCFSCKHDR